MCATHPRWQTQANCDAFRVLHCHSLCCQHFRPWSRCRPCLKHLRCGLACEAKQTALNEIRLDEHDWSQTSNLRSLACLRGTGFCHLAGTKRELALRFASSTYFISAGSIKESLIRREGKRGGFGFLFWWCWWSVVASFYRKKTKNHHLDHMCSCISGPAKTNCFFSVRVSCPATSSENGSACFEPAARSNPPSWLCIRMKSDHREMSYLKRWA